MNYSSKSFRNFNSKFTRFSAFRRLVSCTLLIVGILVLAACSGGGSGSGQTLYALKKEMNFPNDVHKKLPVPEGSSVRTSMGQDGNYFAMVMVKESYPKTIDFFSKNLEKYDWEILEERIPEEEEGERKARWELEGNGVKASIEFTAFGGPEGTMMSAEYFVTEN